MNMPPLALAVDPDKLDKFVGQPIVIFLLGLFALWVIAIIVLPFFVRGIYNRVRKIDIMVRAALDASRRQPR